MKHILIIVFALALSACASNRPDAQWNHSGALVESVRPGSTADAEGIQPGDRIIAMGSGWTSTDIYSAEQLLGLLELRFNQQGSIVLFYVRPDGSNAVAGFWVEEPAAGLVFAP